MSDAPSPAATRLRAGAIAAIAVAAAAALLPFAALPASRPILLNLGPNDQDYTRGFREEWERDGRTRFHWTTLDSAVRLPVRLQGDGHVLRMRLRRHFIEPATVTLDSQGAAFARFDIASDPKVPYRVFELPLPPQDGSRDVEIGFRSASTNPRPLGVAVDWIEVVPARATALGLHASTRVMLIAVALAACVAILAAGGARALAFGAGLAVAAAGAAGLALDVLAAERILREGGWTFVGMALGACVLVRLPAVRRALPIETGERAGALVAIVLAALGVRLVLLLHPQFYYPDVKVHALFAWQLARRGLVAFLRDFTANQYRYSLGLQFESGHWYAFPYPPGFYLLTWPLTTLGRVRPEIAVSLVAAVANSLEAIAVYAIARRLERSARTALAAAACLPVLPIFLARLSLAYFPALVGHAVDAIVLWYLLAHLRAFDRPRVAAGFGLLLAVALLTYTQSVLNFAVIIPLVLLATLVRERAWRPAIGLVVASALGVVLSLALFYGRYVPIAIDMAKGVPMPEEQILVEKQERERASRAAVEETAERTPDDPYAGPGVDVLRGLRKAAWRMWVFYGPFAFAVLLGLLALCADATTLTRRFALAWAATYVVLNLLSGALPGPNLVRYNKDHEIVAPLCCVALAALGAWLWRRTRIGAALYAASFVAFGLWQGWGYLLQRFVFER